MQVVKNILNFVNHLAYHFSERYKENNTKDNYLMAIAFMEKVRGGLTRDENAMKTSGERVANYFTGTIGNYQIRLKRSLKQTADWLKDFVKPNFVLKVKIIKNLSF